MLGGLVVRRLGRAHAGTNLRGSETPVPKKNLEMSVETIKIQERYTKKAVHAARIEEPDMASYLKLMREKLEVLLGELRDNREQRKQWAARREMTKRRKADMECHAYHQEGHLAREGPSNTTPRSGNGQSPPSQ